MWDFPKHIPHNPKIKEKALGLNIAYSGPSWKLTKPAGINALKSPVVKQNKKLCNSFWLYDI